MKNITIAVFIISCFSSTIFAQSRSYTGAGDLASNTSIVQKSKTRHRIRKEAEPTNSETLMPLAELTEYPSVSFKPTTAGSYSEESIHIIGAKVGDKVYLSVPRGSVLPGANWIAWVVSDNQVKIRFTNNGETTQNPEGIQVFKIRVVKQ